MHKGNVKMSFCFHVCVSKLGFGRFICLDLPKKLDLKASKIQLVRKGVIKVERGLA